MNVIGLVGEKGSGKTTAFKILSKYYPTHEVMIAQYLKSVCATTFGKPLNDFNDPILKETPWPKSEVLTKDRLTDLALELGIDDAYAIAELYRIHENVKIESPRKALQYIGTDIIRKINPQIHIQKALRTIRPEKLNIITDIRFPNEFEPFVKNPVFNFLPLYIVRPGREKDTHESEIHVAEIGKRCFKIDNDSTEEKLEEKLLNYVRPFLKKAS